MKMQEPTLTDDIINAWVEIALEMADAIREVLEIPSGHLHAKFGDRLNLDAYELLLRHLVKTKLVEVTPANLIKWIGP